MNEKLKSMKIILLDADYTMCEEWKKCFGTEPNVEIAHERFDEYMRLHKVDCVVSPANSYGLMDGGYDLAITEWFGRDLQKKVQNYILEHFYGEQPVGTSIIIDTGLDNIKLIHTPSMMYPAQIKDPLVVYQCTRSCLMTAMENGIKSIIVPAFGGLTGRLDRNLIARMMRRAYEQLSDPPTKLDWTYASSARVKI